MMTNSKIAPLFAAIAITASGVFLIASPSSAKERPVVVEAPLDESVSVKRVSYADLNLASASGEKMLHRRVGTAVRQVCDTANPGAQLADVFMCRDMSWDDARPQVARAVARARTSGLADNSSFVSTAIVVAVR